MDTEKEGTISQKNVAPSATNASSKLISTKETNEIEPEKKPDSKAESTKVVVDAVKSSAEETSKKPGAPAARSKDERKKSFKFILGYAKRECCSIIIGILFLIGGSLSDLSVPFFIGKVIDLLSKGDYDAIGDYCLYMLAIILFSGICVGMRAAIFNILSERIARNLRKDFYESIINKDITFFDERRTGDLGKLLVADIL